MCAAVFKMHLFERQSDRGVGEREMSSIPFPFPDGYNMWGWTRAKPGCWNSTPVSAWVARSCVLDTLHCCLRYINRVLIGSGAAETQTSGPTLEAALKTAA